MDFSFRPAEERFRADLRAFLAGARGRTIAAGSSEVQRNILADRVLGLPR